MTRKASRLALPALLTLATTGCSFAFVKGPPRGHEEMAEFTCTESRAIPIFETIWTGLFVVGGISALADQDEEQGWFEPTPEQVATVSLGISVPLGASAIVGFRRVNSCRAAVEELRQRAADSNSTP
jgi:hypothetical protein